MYQHNEHEMSEHEQEFVQNFGHFINGQLYHKKAVAEAMANDHRYLVGQKGELAIEFLAVLARYYTKGYYDPRNEYACRAARVAIDALKDAGLYWERNEDNVNAA